MADYVSPPCVLCLQDDLEPQFVAESANVILVAASEPLGDGHMLVVPRAHAPAVATLASDVQAEVRRLAERALALLQDARGAASVLEYADLDDPGRHACWHVLPVAAEVQAPAGGAVRVERLEDMRRLRELALAWRQYVYLEGAAGALAFQPRPGEGAALLERLARMEGAASPSRRGRDAAHWLRERWQRRMAEAGEPVQVVTCVLRREGRVCLLRRSPLLDSAPGMWHGVSGYLPDGVDPLEQAVREIKQEVGLEPWQIELVRAAEPVVFGSAMIGHLWQIYPFLFEVKEGEPRLNWEHTDLAWVHPSRLEDYDCIRSLPMLVRLLFQRA